MFMFPAVGRLIFASCPELAQRTGSHLFDSPRPYPHSRLGSHPAKRRPITLTRVGHRTQSASLMEALDVMCLGSLLGIDCELKRGGAVL
jgi:hypothetical protein